MRPIHEHEGKRQSPFEAGPDSGPTDQFPSSEIVASARSLSLEQLAARVLDPKRIRSPEGLLSAQFREELAALNQKVLAEAGKSGGRDSLGPLLKSYGDALLVDCQGFADGCRGIRYFERDPRSSEIAKLIARADSTRYLQMILIALKIRPPGWDPELAEMLLDRPDRQLTDEQRRHATAIHSLIETALLNWRKRNADNREARKMMERIRAWKLIEDRTWNLSDAGTDALFSLIANTGMVYSDDGTLHPGFRELMARQSQDPNGYMSVQKKILSDSKVRLQEFDLTPVNEMNEILFTLDSVYTGRMTSSAGLGLFAGIKGGADDLERATNSFVRIQFLLALKEGTEMAKGIFNGQVRVEELLRYAIRESAAVQRVWSTFRARIQPMRTFVLSAARTRDQSEARAARLSRIFDSVDASILMGAVYPHELVLFHILSRRKFELQLPSGRPVGSGDLLRLLFEGDLPPIFDYAHTDRTLNAFEVLHSIDLAFRTNLFEIAGIDPDEFIAEVVHQISASGTTTIETSLGSTVARLTQGNSYSTFKRTCEEFRGGPLNPRHFYFGDIIASPYFGPTLGDAFNSIGSNNAIDTEKSRSTKTEQSLFYLDNEFAEAVEVARLDFGGLIRLANAMVTSYENHLAAIGRSANQIRKSTVRARAEISRVRKLRERVLAQSKSLYDEVGYCYFRAARKDIDMKMRLLNIEMDYLRGVHQKIRRLRDPEITETERARILASATFSGMPSGYRGQDKISADGYLLTQPDLLIRMARYIRDVAPHVTADLGQKLDLNVPIIQEPLSHFLPYTDSETEFLESAMRTIIRGVRSFLLWAPEHSPALIRWDGVVKSIVTLSRLETDMTGKSEFYQPDLILNTQAEILNVANISPEERELLTVLHRDTKHSPGIFGSVMLKFEGEEQRVVQLWHVFDYPLKLMQEELLGYNWTNMMNSGAGFKIPQLRAGYERVAREYYQSRAKDSRLHLLLPYNPDLDRHLDTEIGRFVRSELKSIGDFQAHLLERARKRDRIPRFDLNLAKTYTDSAVDENVVRSWAAKISLLHASTDYCYKSDETCAAFRTTNDRDNR